MATDSTAKLDRWGKPLPRKLTLKSGKVVTERVYDKSQYHQNCRACGGDVYGQAIWYVRRDEANVTPKHVECPAEPVPSVEVKRAYAAPAPKSQSVYAQRRQDASRPAAARPSTDRVSAHDRAAFEIVGDDQYIVVHGQLIEIE